MTSVGSLLGGHGGYLAVALATHALVGYVLGARLFGRPWAGVVGGLLADVDLLVPAAWGAPLAHRGLMHSPIAAGAAVVIASRLGWSTAGAVGAGYVSQLLIDLTTPKGILLTYPFSTEAVAVPLGGHSPVTTVLLWTACLGVLWRQRQGLGPTPVTARGTPDEQPGGDRSPPGRIRPDGPGPPGGRSPPPR